MASQEFEAEALRGIAAHLFRVGRSLFHEAHLIGMSSFKAATLGEGLEKMDKAIEQERQAIAIQEEAIEFQRQAILKREEDLVRLRSMAGL